jgi:Reverse transcriptase (RNA-dependent DNA polymerase).
MNAEQKKRLREVGKEAFVREEMTRLGFWPPNPQVGAELEVLEAQVRPLYEEMAGLRTELDAIEQELAKTGDIPKLLEEIRRKRIERVRAERAQKKEAKAKADAEKAAADAQWRRTTLPFLGRGVSAGLVYEGGDAEKVAGLGLPALASASDVARAIGIDERELAWLTYERIAANQDHYSRFAIPKKKGGVRVISSPKPKLRVAQTWLLHSVVEKLPVHEAAMAFRPGLSVKDNAERHAGRAVIVKVDLKDFFPSVGVKRVKRLFESFGYNEGVSTLLALIATESPRVLVTLDGVKKWVAMGGRSLPQGACTSPGLTNLLCRGMDARLTGAAASMGFAYTRYADDLIFSHEKGEAPVGMLLSLVRDIIAACGFTVNEEKTRVLRPQHRQNVTGVVVNRTAGEDGAPAVRVSRDDLRRFRAVLHQCDRDGFEAVTAKLGRDARSYARGYLSFVRMVNAEQAEKLAARHPWLTA